MASLRAPGPGYRALELSDRSVIWMPPEATAQHWRQAKDQGEAALDQKYMAQAQAENRPITTNGKVYSATVARSNTPYGHLMGWLDHNLGGNALNRNPTAQTVNSYAAPVVGSGARIATGAVDAIPVVGAADLASTGINVGKHVAANAFPSLNKVPDLPTAVGWLRQTTGTPQLDPNAPAAQRVFESTMSGTPGRSLLDTAGRTGLSYVGGEAGQKIAGEPGQLIGSSAGASPEASGNAALRVISPLLRGRNTADVSAAAARQGIQPTMGEVSGPVGRLMEKAVGAVPFVGGPVKSAQERFNDAIARSQQNVAERVYGSQLPGDIGPGDIGESLIAGARQGQANLSQRAQDEQGDLMRNITQGQPPLPGGTTPTQPVNLRSVYYGPAGYPKQFSGGTEDWASLAARLDNLRTMAVQQQTPRFQQVWGQMPAGTIPYQRAQVQRSNIGADIPGASGMSKGDEKQLYAALTQAMRDAAVARDPALGPAFDFANENYQRIIGQGGQRSQLEKIGGEPVGGDYRQFYGSGGQTQPTIGATFLGGKDEGGAYDWFNGKLRSPSAFDQFADPRVVPNEYWRQAVGGWLATRGQTPEDTYRPDLMAKQWGKVDNTVKTQLFTGPTGQPTADVTNMDDTALLGRNTVVPVERAGLTNTTGSVFAIKWLLDKMAQGGGAATSILGGRALASGMESPTFVNAIRGQYTPLVDSLYAGVPAATQNIMQSQTNPPPDPLGYSVTAGQTPPQ